MMLQLPSSDYNIAVTNTDGQIGVGQSEQTSGVEGESFLDQDPESVQTTDGNMVLGPSSSAAGMDRATQMALMGRGGAVSVEIDVAMQGVVLGSERVVQGLVQESVAVDMQPLFAALHGGSSVGQTNTQAQTAAEADR